MKNAGRAVRLGGAETQSMRWPTLFISHGSPMLVIDPSPARDFLAGYGRELGKPRAIVIASAHFNASRPAVVADAHPRMIYDFGGSNPALFQMVYPAPGDPGLAEQVAALLQAGPCAGGRCGARLRSWRL